MPEKLISVVDYCKNCDWVPECGGCDRLLYDVMDRPCRNYSVDELYPECPDFADRVTEVNGFGLSDIKVSRFSIPSLPAKVIPSFRRGDLHRRWDVGNCVSITIQELVNRGSNQVSLRLMHGLPKKTLLIITMCCKDQHLENVWLRTNGKEIMDILRKESPCIVIGPDFSLYMNSPRCTHMLNTKRSLVVFQRLLEAGIPTIPFVSLHNHHDVERWASWLNASRSICMVGTSLQTLKNDNKIWRLNVQLLAKLDELTGKRLHWLVIGVAANHKLAELRKNLFSFSIISSDPVQAAVHGNMRVNGKLVRSLITDSYELTKLNIRDLDRCCRGELVFDFEILTNREDLLLPKKPLWMPNTEIQPELIHL